MASSPNKTVYGMPWDANTPPLQIEFWMCRQTEAWLKKRGRSKFFHYRNAQKLLWPTDDQHRWSNLILERFLEKEITVLMGCGASNKTYSMAKYALTDWWAFPNETLWLISSTEYRGVDLRIWGDIQLLFNNAMKLHDWLPGTPLVSLHAITVDALSDDDDYFKAARSLKRGLIVVPNKKGNVNVGLSAFVGVRVPRLRHAGDEVQMMSTGFADAYSNWYGNSDFRGVMGGNPLDITDQLCTIGEPADGWDNFVDTGKTQEWTAKFFNAHVIALDGRDSPNYDFPNPDTTPRFPYLVGPKKLNAVAATHGKESWQWFSQCVGKPNKGLLLWRVITSQMCANNKAHDIVIWKGTPTTSIYALDPAYGGGDRCIGGKLEFGEDVDGQMVLKIHPQENIPINLRLKEEPEEQIAKFVKRRLTELNIPVDHCGYDSFGKGTLGFYFAQVFGSSTPLPIDSGAQPSDRPVRHDLFIIDNNQRRYKRCDEHYSKFVSELWFSVAEVIQSKQLRELAKPTMQEGCMRMYSVVKGSKLEVESKDDMKERMGKSPDLFDQLAIGVEMARRLGFKIERIGREVEVETPNQWAWFKNRQREQQRSSQTRALDFSG